MVKGRMPYRACGPFLLAALICGCGTETRPSAEESARLDNAADMLNQAEDDLSDIDSNALGDPNGVENSVKP